MFFSSPPKQGLADFYPLSGKRIELCSDAFNAVARGGCCQDRDLVAFVDQETTDSQQRIEVTGPGSRS